MPQAFCTVVGTHFRGSEAKHLVNDLTKGETGISVLAEPDNEYDENAVACFFDDVHIGYLSKDNNRMIAQYLGSVEDAADLPTTEIVDFDGRKPVILITWPDQKSPHEPR